MKSTLSKKKRSIFPRLVALVGIVNPIFCVLVFTLAGLLRPGYSPISQAISDLGVGPNAWMLNTDLVITGLLFIIFDIGFYQLMRPVISKRWLQVSTIFLVLSGAGVINEGIFHQPLPADPNAHLYRVMHGLGLSVIFYSLIFALLIIGWHLCRNPVWRRFGWYSVVTALVTFGLLLVPEDLTRSLHIIGLVERIQVIEAFAWSVVIGCRLFTLESTRPDRYV